MKKLIVFFAAILIAFTLPLNGQNLTSENGGYAKKEKINGKKFRVVYYEYEIDKTIDEVWTEVAGNYMHVSTISKSITESHSESGDLTEGLGAQRFCSIDFQGRTVEVKERVIDYQDKGDRREFTYEVYESKGFPAKVYNTWVVRKGKDGKTYLGTAFKMRGKPALMTGMMAKKLKKVGGVKNGVLAYKHYLETGEQNVDSSILAEKYPD